VQPAAVATVAVAVALLGSLTGCARPVPEHVSGDPAPITAAPTSSTGGPSRTAGRPSTGTTSQAPTVPPAPTLPDAYQTLSVTKLGATLSLSVPQGWLQSRRDGPGESVQYDFRDPTNQVLLRILAGPRTAQTARAGWEAYEKDARASFPGYRLIGISDVIGPGDSSADWKFSFLRDGVRRRVIDRSIVAGDAGFAVYYSAPERFYGPMEAVWDMAVGRLTVG
jgi:eukaryotic-like serine/threonine-protein kinase